MNDRPTDEWGSKPALAQPIRADAADPGPTGPARRL